MSDTRPDSSPPKRRSRKPATVAQPAAETPAALQAETGERIAKVMARAGLCSRRDAEAWIKEGRVAVNGKTLSSPALNIGPDDAITVDGQPVTARERTRLFLYHKPRGLVTTARDPEGRPTVFEALPDELPRVVSVGRLDINTEGLLLLTNDGGLARMLELPATGWLRRYRVRANGFITQEKLDALRDGITIDGVDYVGIEAALDRTQGANQWLTMGLREGKNREIKRVLEHLGLFVNRLIRLSFGPFQLGELAEGAVEEVRTRVLKDQLGEALAAAAGVMWEDAVEAEVVTRDVAPARRKERPARGDARQGERPAAREPTSRGRDGASPRADAPQAERPRQDRPAPKARPHVSALRGDPAAKAGTDGPRKRISRATTEDRRGRTVKVERVTVESRERVKSGEGGTSRNARNFAQARRDAEFGEGAPPRKSGGTRPRGGERAGGFSSERPLTGRALKDGKVRTSPGREADGRPARSRSAAEAGSAKGRNATAPRGAAPRQGDRPQGGKGRPQGGSGRPQGGDRPRGGGGSRPPRGTK